MSHDLEMRNGSASMVFNSRHGNPWHELGTAVDGSMTAQQALSLSKQDWEVWKDQLDHNGYKVPAWGIFRCDTGVLLGTCGEGYEPIQNVVQFDAIDALLESSEGAHYDTAGVLGRGERVWTLARIPEADITVAGTDKHEAFLLACTSHDGSLAFTLKLCQTRVVCQNTLTMALNSNGALARVKHTRNAADRLENARRYLGMVGANAKTLEEKLNVLAARKMTKQSYMGVMDKLFPAPKDENGEAKNQTRRDNILGDIIRMYESNDRNAVPAIRGTAYNLLNAITEYTDHARTARISSDKENNGYTVKTARTESALFGSGETLKNRALEVILEDTKGNPVIQTIPQQFSGPRTTGSGLLDSILDSTPQN